MRTGELSVDVAELATGLNVSTCERKTREIVIEGGRLPGIIRVALAAILIKRTGLMIRIPYGFIIIAMTGETGGRRAGIGRLGVAGSAIRSGVATGQREFGRMGEFDAQPCFRVRIMARLAVNGERCGDVIGFLCGLEILEMTGYTLGAQSGIQTAGMTGLTVDVCVISEQGKLRLLMQMTHPGAIGPAVHRVTFFASIRELTTVNIDVTREALGFSLSKYQARMASEARHIDVPADQWETGGIVDKRDWRSQRSPIIGRVTGLT